MFNVIRSKEAAYIAVAAEYDTVNEDDMNSVRCLISTTFRDKKVIYERRN
jgi:hypothetical protein